MNKLTSFSLVLTLLCGAATSVIAAEASHAAPSKDDIIKALTAPVGDVAQTRGFAVHPAVPGGPAPKAGTPASLKMNEGTAKPAAPAHASINEEILFGLNSAESHPMSKEALSQIAQALAAPQLKDAKILVEGHTDSTGTPERNLSLSQERAEAVRNYLVNEAGISPDRLSAVGKGQSEPIDPNNPLAPENRRVVLVNLTN
jgi:OOP family OmpA-OmpF porin